MASPPSTHRLTTGRITKKASAITSRLSAVPSTQLTSEAAAVATTPTTGTPASSDVKISSAHLMPHTMSSHPITRSTHTSTSKPHVSVSISS